MEMGLIATDVLAEIFRSCFARCLDEQFHVPFVSNLTGPKLKTEWLQKDHNHLCVCAFGLLHEENI